MRLSVTPRAEPAAQAAAQAGSGAPNQAEGTAIAFRHGRKTLDVLHAFLFPDSAPNGVLEEDDATLVDVVEALLANPAQERSLLIA